MKRVERSEVLDYVTYEERRDTLRREAMREKDARRIHVGPHLTFLFETHGTILYQIQEMVRAEKIVREADIAHEIETYNELLGGAGELGCTLLVEVDDPAVRAEKLAAWLELPAHLYALLEDGSKARAVYDPRQVGEGRVSSVQYLKFPVGPRSPAAIGCDHPDPDLCHETRLTGDQRAALQRDLAG